VSPLSVELESAPWPRRFNANTLPSTTVTTIPRSS
jgi:hypothetical protein